MSPSYILYEVFLRRIIKMFFDLYLPGTTSLKETICLYLEGVKEFFDELQYYIAKFELRI